MLQVLDELACYVVPICGVAAVGLLVALAPSGSRWVSDAVMVLLVCAFAIALIAAAMDVSS